MFICVSCVWYKLWITMKYQFVNNVIQLQLYRYQLYIHQHATKVITTIRTYWWTHGTMGNENNFTKWSFEVRSSKYIYYVGFFSINNAMVFMFSIFSFISSTKHEAHNTLHIQQSNSPILQITTILEQKATQRPCRLECIKATYAHFI